MPPGIKMTRSDLVRVSGEIRCTWMYECGGAQEPWMDVGNAAESMDAREPLMHASRLMHTRS
jgi:hypothetical protein